VRWTSRQPVDADIHRSINVDPRHGDPAVAQYAVTVLLVHHRRGIKAWRNAPDSDSRQSKSRGENGHGDATG
jgi:hypothetical protein